MIFDIDFDLLNKEGYLQIPFDTNIAYQLEIEFDQWRNSFGFDLPRSHGIYQHYGISQTSFQYKAKHYFKSLFQALFPYQDLLFSLDGACYYPPETKLTRKSWLHRDLKPQDNFTLCYQGVIDLIPTEGGLTIQPYSHSIDTSQYHSNKHWWKIPFELQGPTTILKVSQPTITIWNSRLFHMNTPSYRKALYISAQPIQIRSKTKIWQTKRLDYIHKQFTFSHWANSNAKNNESKFRSPSEKYSPNLILHSIRSSINYTPTKEDLQLVGIY
jgi:hypothetical protein